jgi:hypothetical protein
VGVRVARVDLPDRQASLGEYRGDISHEFPGWRVVLCQLTRYEFSDELAISVPSIDVGHWRHEVFAKSVDSQQAGNLPAEFTCLQGCVVGLLRELGLKRHPINQPD